MDGYGHCFENVVGDRPWTIYQSNGVQWGQFAKYKFYLALENSVHCTDYMSEKFWRNSLRQGLVPIVSGMKVFQKIRFALFAWIHLATFTNLFVTKNQTLQVVIITYFNSAKYLKLNCCNILAIQGKNAIQSMLTIF